MSETINTIPFEPVLGPPPAEWDKKDIIEHVKTVLIDVHLLYVLLADIHFIILRECKSSWEHYLSTFVPCTVSNLASTAMQGYGARRPFHTSAVRIGFLDILLLYSCFLHSGRGTGDVAPCLSREHVACLGREPAFI